MINKLGLELTKMNFNNYCKSDPWPFVGGPEDSICEMCGDLDCLCQESEEEA